MAISKIKQNSLTTGIIDEELLTADVITEQTELAETANNADFILVYDTSAGALKKVLKSNFTLQVPTLTSITPTNALSGDGTGNYTFVITGTGFTGASADLLNDSGTDVAFDTVTVDSSTQITGVIAKSSLPNSGEPYDVRVTAASGLTTTLANQITIDAQPVFSTAAGSLGTVANGARSGLSFTVAAADPESGGDPVYTLESGSIPAGLSFASTSSGAVISGTADAVGSNTTSNFTIRAKDAASNVSDRAFSITVLAPVYQSFTSSGTFSVPSGVSSVNVLVVAGGGSGGSEHGSTGTGGGGAGGLIDRPGFTVTPGGTVSVTVGNGGAANSGSSTPDTPGRPNANGNVGQDSVFGTLTAKGGGGGGYSTSPAAHAVGGSGGGGGAPDGNGGPGIQPTESGESGNYGFGNSGGQGGTPGGGQFAGGGGGGGAGAAGQTGQPAPGGGAGGNGGVGKAYTIADGTSSVYYAGGGGADAGNAGPGQNGTGGQGGGTDGVDGGGSSQAGTANRGGGSGATRSSGTAGAGGKGIVIVSY